MNPESSAVDWNRRFTVQAGWTKPLRDFLIEQTGMNSASNILEVGSGTGVILRSTNEKIGGQAVGIDFNLETLSQNKTIQHDQVISCADVYSLPFPVNSFDFVISHYFFLWLKFPSRALLEVQRVLKPGGIAIAFAEPDYEARIDYPEQFQPFGDAQTKSLIDQGINSKTGRSLPSFFSTSGFTEIKYGISGFQIPVQVINQDWESEWKILQYDLSGYFSSAEMNQYKSEDKISRLSGSRVSWIPTFYAIGRKN
jgi:ubiquinone/menaquinone biosynthesis C-methylase UbiE